MNNNTGMTWAYAPHSIRHALPSNSEFIKTGINLMYMYTVQEYKIRSFHVMVCLLRRLFKQLEIFISKTNHISGTGNFCFFCVNSYFTKNIQYAEIISGIVCHKKLFSITKNDWCKEKSCTFTYLRNFFDTWKKPTDKR